MSRQRRVWATSEDRLSAVRVHRGRSQAADNWQTHYAATPARFGTNRPNVRRSAIIADLVAFYASNDLGSDPTVLRDYAQAVEGAGYARMSMGEHVLGADPNRPGGWAGPYTHETEWQEPFPTFGYLAAVTERIELMTGILILPQRQTALVAKQAAQLDVLLGGRLVLGVGTGWNPVEYHALGQDFHTRGRRMEEQVGLLRQLWRDPVVTFEGRWDQVDQAGIKPLPPRRDIPIWMGGGDPRAVARAGRIGDGWFPLGLDRVRLEAGIEIMRACRRGGRARPGAARSAVLSDGQRRHRARGRGRPRPRGTRRDAPQLLHGAKLRRPGRREPTGPPRRTHVVRGGDAGVNAGKRDSCSWSLS